MGRRLSVPRKWRGEGIIADQIVREVKEKQREESKTQEDAGVNKTVPMGRAPHPPPPWNSVFSRGEDEEEMGPPEASLICDMAAWNVTYERTIPCPCPFWLTSGSGGRKQTPVLGNRQQQGINRGFGYTTALRLQKYKF